MMTAGGRRLSIFRQRPHAGRAGVVADDISNPYGQPVSP
jgi:hypothetical protein